MATQDKVNFAVSMTPVEVLDSSEVTTQEYDVVWSGTGKTLGGGGTLELAGSMDASIGYNQGVVAYVAATVGGAPLNADSTEKKGIFIRNTGYVYSSATVLGAATSDSVILTIGGAAIASLGPDQAMFFPNHDDSADDLKTSGITITRSGSDDIAVEFLAVVA